MRLAHFDDLHVSMNHNLLRLSLRTELQVDCCVISEPFKDNMESKSVSCGSSSWRQTKFNETQTCDCVDDKSNFYTRK